MNLVPEERAATPDYYCTWSAQNFGRESDGQPGRPTDFEGDQGARSARHFLNDEVVFAEKGMIDQFDPIRGDLFFVFDDGWDVPYGVHPDIQRHRFGSLELDEERFPSCGGHPAQRLRKLNDRVKSHGWRGAGLWVAAQAQGEGRDGWEMDGHALEEYWRQRVRWSAEAGIGYWKVDWGHRQGDLAFRRMLSRIAREEAPELIIEHCRNCAPINNWEIQVGTSGQPDDGRFGDWDAVASDALRILGFSDVLRTYDVSAPLSTATTMTGWPTYCPTQSYFPASRDWLIARMNSI